MQLDLSDDLHEFLKLLDSTKVEFVLVGAYALAYHGAPRFTEDIDFFVSTSPKNAEKLLAVIEEFGFGSLGLRLEDFQKPDMVIQLGRAPNRIDLLTGIDGVTWEDVWEKRQQSQIDGFPVAVIDLESLCQNKEKTARDQDLIDLKRLRQREEKSKTDD